MKQFNCAHMMKQIMTKSNTSSMLEEDGRYVPLLLANCLAPAIEPSFTFVAMYLFVLGLVYVYVWLRHSAGFGFGLVLGLALWFALCAGGRRARLLAGRRNPPV